jgi:DNA topoisomerase-3
MGKNLFIAEKPSVAMEFAKALDMNLSKRQDGYVEDGDNIVTWCVGHLIQMLYPDAYDESLKKWSLDTIPFIPKQYKYGVIPNTEKQYAVVSKLLNRKDVDNIYYSGDSAREGEYIQRLVRQEAGHNPNAKEYRVWIDSQTREEILNGIRNAKDLSFYNTLSDSAYARAIEDYLIGMNFSRALTLKYSRALTNAVGNDNHVVIAVGRVMSCVLGMVVERERQIRSAVVVPFYGIRAGLGNDVDLSWKITNTSKFMNDPEKYSEAGLLNKSKVEGLISDLSRAGTVDILSVKTSKENKQAPLLFNLAELQGECTRRFHISPADTLNIAQKLYEAKLTTYPRTDARVLTTAICKVYEKNIGGLKSVPEVAAYADEILRNNWQDDLRNKKTKYVDDSKVSDHYAIIPTGDHEGLSNFGKLTSLEKDVYLLIARRFLSIFYPAAVYDKAEVTAQASSETFTGTFKALDAPGYLAVSGDISEDPDAKNVYRMAAALSGTVPASFSIKEGKSATPKRYTTGSMILAMENAGNLIDDPDLREQIKGSGIGTSATRAEVITKLEKNKYIKVDKKTQIITPDKAGELIYDVLRCSIPNILNPKYTASWETGLQQIVDGKITKDMYLAKINQYVAAGVQDMKVSDHTSDIVASIDDLKSVYKDLKSVTPEATAVCPVCGKPMYEGKLSFYCSGFREKTCNFAIYKNVSNKILPVSAVKAMLNTTKQLPDGTYESDKTSIIKGFVSKNGKSFDAKLYVTYDGTKSHMKFDFNK